jgi:diphthamide biosynthesis enzyme Dph1/Dph2-like protein
MEKVFIPAILKSSINSKKINEISKKLPKKITLCYSIQYKKVAEEIKSILEKTHKITEFIQVLGCSKPKVKGEAILLISNGKFHAISLYYETKVPTYILDHDNFTKINDKDIEIFEKKERASMLKFLNAEQVGFLISTKEGQQRLKKALKKGKSLKKESYYFLANNLDAAQFENFPQIKSWINTACPRMDLNDKDMINISKI